MAKRGQRGEATVETVMGGVPRVHTELVGEPVAGILVHVEVALSRTLSMGAYESVRLHVGLTMPCGVGEEGATYKRSLAWVSKRLGRLVGDVADGAG